MALHPSDVTPGMTVYGTWTRVHPATQESQTRVAETAAEAVSMRWHGWVRLDEGETPTGPTVKPAAEAQPATRAPRRTQTPAVEPDTKPE
jgi:hypothetical protein